MGRNAVGVGAVLTVTMATAVHLAGASIDGSASDLVLLLGRFHPLVVHLPIGALLIAVLMEGASFVPRLRERLDGSVSFVLVTFTGSSLVGFVLGHLLAQDGGYPARLLGLHRALAFATVLGAAACLVVWTWGAGRRDRLARSAYRLVLTVTLSTLTIAAHFGGSMTRGEGWLVRFAPAFVQRLLGEVPEPEALVAPPPPGDEPLVFRDGVLPILKARCVECHGPEQSKGSLRLDSFSALLAGGDGGPAIVPRAGTRSPLVTRMLLPPSDDDHMPPEGREGPTQAEIEVVRWWIDRGAGEDLRVLDALPPEAGREVLERAGKSVPFVVGPPAVSASAAVEPTTKNAQEPTGTPRASADALPQAHPQAPAGAVLDAPAPALDGLAYREVIAPILASRCGSCHGAARQKGKLRLDSVPAMQRGGATGPALVAGNVERSLMISRTRLAKEDELHMPPARSPQPTAFELDVLAWWIGAGASEDVALAATPASLRRALAAGPPPPPNPSPAGQTVAGHGLDGKGAADPTATAPLSEPFPDGDVDLYRVARRVLDRRCVSCHSDEGPAGKLSLETYPSIVRGGKNGPVVAPDRASESVLLHRMKLPKGDTKHMPPSDEPQPIAAELEALRMWIDAGASDTTTLKRDAVDASTLETLQHALDPPPGAAPVATEPAPKPTTAPVSPTPPIAPAGGCAHCSVGSGGSFTTTALAVLLALCGLLARRSARRSRSSPSRGRERSR